MKSVILGFYVWSNNTNGDLATFPKYKKDIARPMRAAPSDHSFVGYVALKEPLKLELESVSTLQPVTKYLPADKKRKPVCMR